MKKFLPVILGLFILGSVQAQMAQQIPNYFGFYLLKIPDFTWVEGASVQGEFKRYSGVLNMENTRAPLFMAEGRDPVPLTLNQASALLLDADAKKRFDLLGVEGKSQDPGETAASFFVPFYAEINGQRINLIPTMTPSDVQNRQGPSGKPTAGPGGVGGKFSY